MNKRKRQQVAKRVPKEVINQAIREMALQRNFQSYKTLTKADVLHKKSRLRLQEMADMSSPARDYSHEQRKLGSI